MAFIADIDQTQALTINLSENCFEQTTELIGDGCDRAIPKILTDRNTSIQPYKSIPYESLEKDEDVPRFTFFPSSTS